MEIVVLDSGYKSYLFEKELFEGNGFTFKIYHSYIGSLAEKIAFAKEATGLLVRHTIIDTAFLAAMKNLKAVVRYGIGYDNLDLDACNRFGIKAANVQGYANHSVSEHALALLLACSRGMWDTGTQVLKQFAAPPTADIFELHDKTIGIIGLGRIGSTFAKKAKPLFKRVIASDPYKSADYFNTLQVEKTSLQHLLQEADVISVHCNLTNETKHLLDDKAFTAMKKRPVIINTARGPVIDERALLNALKSDTIHSAGIDVYENEPVTALQEELINHHRTICTRHYAWYSDYAAIELQKRAATNLYNLLNGIMVEDCLNP